MNKIRFILLILITCLALVACSSEPNYTYSEQQDIETATFYLKSNNSLGVTENNLSIMDNPVGNGRFVYVDLEEFDNADIYVLWYVIDGGAYPVNGNTQGLQASGMGKSLTIPVKKELKGSNLHYLSTPEIIEMVFTKDDEDLIDKYIKIIEERKAKDEVKNENDEKLIIEPTINDKKIYEYVESIGDQYEDLYGLPKGEDLTFIFAAQKYNISIAETYTAYTVYANKLYDTKTSSTREEMKNGFIDILKNTGFELKNGEWYYEGVKIKDIKMQ